MLKTFKRRLILLSILTLLFLAFGFSKSYAASVLAGGDVYRNPTIGGNVFFNHVYYGGMEFEVDFRIIDWFSIAPHLGLGPLFYHHADAVPGCSFRFAIPPGVRPHGMFIGPGIEVEVAHLVGVIPYGEFGWRYTFDYGPYGLSLMPFMRFGARFYPERHYDETWVSFWWALGFGIGYSIP